MSEQSRPGERYDDTGNTTDEADNSHKRPIASNGPIVVEEIAPPPYSGKMITFDFETKAIEPYPNYPPEPVGVALKYDDLPSVYLSWGHPTENNCTFEAAKVILAEVYESGHELLAHHARFDMAVAEKFFGWKWPQATTVHDTMYLIFLNNPLQKSLSLKPSAELLLGWPPEEQEAVRNWLILHGVVPSNKKDWGEKISEAPGDLVGRYAAGDTDRTKALFDLLYPKIIAEGMGEAYQREQFCAPIFNQSEAEGIHIDMSALKFNIDKYDEAFKRATRELKTMLGHEYNEEFNIDSGVQLAEAIRAHGFGVPDDEWPKTPTGKFSTARDTLMEVISDERLALLLAYRGVLKTLLGTFMKPWYEKGLATGGILHPRWNQVKSDEYGAKTGRLSSSDPNFQNIPTEFDEKVPEGYPELPHIRRFVLPDPGEVFVSADFHSQEIRMLGHFAKGAIKEVYDDDPSADIHQVAADIIADNTGLQLKRKHTKIVAFSILYGAGTKTMADRMGVSYAEAGQIKRAYLKVLTGVKEYMDLVEFIAQCKGYVRSWGGRLLQAPEPVVQSNGQIWNKDYVLLNYIIQGSSADQTKQSIINYHRNKAHGRFLATVHDEICISVPPQHLKSEIARLTAAMEGGQFNIPMRATVEKGRNWDEMESV